MNYEVVYGATALKGTATAVNPFFYVTIAIANIIKKHYFVLIKPFGKYFSCGEPLVLNIADYEEFTHPTLFQIEHPFH